MLQTLITQLLAIFKGIETGLTGDALILAKDIFTGFKERGGIYIKYASLLDIADVKVLAQGELGLITVAAKALEQYGAQAAQEGINAAIGLFTTALEVIVPPPTV